MSRGAVAASTWAQANDSLGSDRPGPPLRIELHDLSEAVGRSEFKYSRGRPRRSFGRCSRSTRPA